MKIKSRFDHFNINVTDLDRSIATTRPRAAGNGLQRGLPTEIHAEYYLGDS